MVMIAVIKGDTMKIHVDYNCPAGQYVNQQSRERVKLFSDPAWANRVRELANIIKRDGEWFFSKISRRRRWQEKYYHFYVKDIEITPKKDTFSLANFDLGDGTLPPSEKIVLKILFQCKDTIPILERKIEYKYMLKPYAPYSDAFLHNVVYIDEDGSRISREWADRDNKETALNLAEVIEILETWNGVPYFNINFFELDDENIKKI